MKKKKIIALLAVLVLMTGCTSQLTDKDGKRIVNESTGQNITENILCLPTEEYFGGWYEDKDLTIPVDLDTYTVTKDVTLYAAWSNDPKAIDKTKDNKVVEEEKVVEEVKVTTTKATSKKNKKKTTTKTTTTTTTTTSTTTASEKTYKVKFDTNGHGDIKSLTVKENEKITDVKAPMSLYENYVKNEKQMSIKLNKLSKCENMKVYESDTYSGIWVGFFVRPLAWIIIKVGKLLGNYGLAVMVVGLLFRILMIPLSAKSAKQNENMKKIQPEMERIERKYANKNDQQSLMMKSQETMVLYKKFDINPLSSCLVAFLQLPLFFAFYEAINRVPAIFENSWWKFQLGTTPLFGIRSGNYWYILLIALILIFTVLSFRNSFQGMSGDSNQAKQSKYMLIFMTVFIGIASIQLPAAIALYWVVTNAFNVVQMAFLKKRGK